jgi:hypothetical protein
VPNRSVVKGFVTTIGCFDGFSGRLPIHQCPTGACHCLQDNNCPDDPVKASTGNEAKRQQVTARIANGDWIAAILVRSQEAQRIREVTQDQALKRSGPFR